MIPSGKQCPACKKDIDTRFWVCAECYNARANETISLEHNLATALALLKKCEEETRAAAAEISGLKKKIKTKKK